MISHEEYYTSLYAKVPGKWVVLSTFAPDSNIPVRTEDLAKAISKRVSEVDESLYATFAVFERPPSKGRGKAEDVSALLGVYLDVDAAKEGKYAEGKNPSMTLDEVKALLLDLGLPEPSAIVNSGRGFHFEYRLSDPFIISSAEDRTRAQRFLKAFVGYAIQKAGERGVKLDAIGDLPRVKRAAGSMNHRPDEPARPVVVVELHTDRTYDLEALESFNPTPVSRRREKASQAKDSGPQWSLIAENEPFIQYSIANASTLSLSMPPEDARAFVTRVRLEVEATPLEWRPGAWLVHSFGSKRATYDDPTEQTVDGCYLNVIVSTVRIRDTADGRVVEEWTATAEPHAAY